MKSIYAFTILSLFLFIAAALPGRADAVVCQNKTAIVYGNGIYNTKEMATDSLFDGLRGRLIQSSPAYADQTKYEYKLAYADNGGATGPLSLSGLQQLLEFARQKKAANDSAFWRWLGGLAASPAWFKTMMKDLAVGTNAVAYVNDVSLQLQLNGDPANPAQQPGYRTLLNDGKRVVIVAHSQGNFYANAAYDALTNASLGGNPALSANIGIVPVATPASIVAGGGPPGIT
ncbi:MAG: hypothetical protein Q9M27_05130, partial [Mariprofundaceae bacterium]|nr:hypothetical protein [Mariprofundaceae bacterium]